MQQVINAIQRKINALGNSTLKRRLLLITISCIDHVERLSSTYDSWGTQELIFFVVNPSFKFAFRSHWINIYPNSRGRVFASSDLHLCFEGGRGLIVPFYSVQDCSLAWGCRRETRQTQLVLKCTRRHNDKKKGCHLRCYYHFLPVSRVQSTSASSSGW